MLGKFAAGTTCMSQSGILRATGVWEMPRLVPWLAFVRLGAGIWECKQWLKTDGAIVS